MRRIITALAVAAVLAGAVFGAAASLGGISGSDLAADDAVIASCDSDGVNVAYSWSLDGTGTDKKTRVGAVLLYGLADACIGKTADITIGTPGGDHSASGVIQANVSGDNNAVLPFVPGPAMSQANTVHVVVR